MGFMHPKIPMDVTLINLQMEDNISVKEMDIPHQRQGPKEENLSYNWLPAGQGWKLEGGERGRGSILSLHEHHTQHLAQTY